MVQSGGDQSLVLQGGVDPEDGVVEVPLEGIRRMLRIV